MIFLLDIFLYLWSQHIKIIKKTYKNINLVIFLTKNNLKKPLKNMLNR
jgi:hypothetical protein